MSDIDLVNALLARDERATQQFFFKDCRPLFMSIIRYVFSYEVDYDEFVNEFYLYLMEKDGARLRQFQGRSSIYQWLKVVAIRYFLAKRDGMIDMNSKGPLSEVQAKEHSVNDEGRVTACLDIEALLRLLGNPRYEYAIRRLVLDDAEPKVVAEELHVGVDNLYNIKKRAIDALTTIALKDWGKYEKMRNGK